MSMALKQSKARAGANFSTLGAAGFVGDPGLFGSIFSGIKKAAGFIPGPIGAVARTFFGPTSPAPTAPILVRPPTNFPGPQGHTLPTFPVNVFQEAPNGRGQVPVPGTRGAIERFVPGGRTGLMACPSGQHPNKTAYWTKSEGFIEAGTKCVKNRRRNPLNPRAASRAIQRIESAKKATRSLSRITIKCNRCGKGLGQGCGCR